jgi:hypothetical protein
MVVRWQRRGNDSASEWSSLLRRRRAFRDDIPPYVCSFDSTLEWSSCFVGVAEWDDVHPRLCS